MILRALDNRPLRLLLTEIVLPIIIIWLPIVAAGQATSSAVEIITTYSENGSSF